MAASKSIVPRLSEEFSYSEKRKQVRPLLSGRRRAMEPVWDVTTRYVGQVRNYTQPCQFKLKLFTHKKFNAPEGGRWAQRCAAGRRFKKGGMQNFQTIMPIIDLLENVDCFSRFAYLRNNDQERWLLELIIYSS
ncbi:hypothetical protein [Burkholderia ambifaria]|uniref:hypothetical protein n=1 Tax=Burkholderia ambifaria TaxID=152480 RepID=UPI0012FE2614|nr:hypothetical protein [Burkholderia ambifaria]